jgi:hypothetical protein
MLTEDLQHGPLTGSDLERQLATDDVIPQQENRPDREFPEVAWNQYGLIPTNEVVVTVRCGPMAFYAKAHSYLEYTRMIDRIFGTDVADIQLGHELANYLWEVYGSRLAVQVLIVRSGRPR